MKVITSIIVVYLVFASSCTVVNNFYVNDPVPVEKDSVIAYIGLGSGFVPIIDSISTNGTVHNSNKLELAPNLCINGQYGLRKQTNLRFAIHLPYIVTGIGVRAGIQQSFFKKEAPFNLAIGTDIGFVFTIDSLFESKLDNAMKNAINADIFLPVSYSFSPNYRIVLTPRLSFNSVYVRQNIYEEKAKVYPFYVPSITLGVILNRIYIETGIHSVNNILMPNFGICYIFKLNRVESGLYGKQI
jgi:hypothetical protein